MKKAKKIIALMLSFVFLMLIMSSCANDDAIQNSDAPVTDASSENNGVVVDSKSVFTLPCSSTDSFNPFFSATLSNNVLMDLIYDGLFKLDREFVAQPILCTEYVNDGVLLTVTLGSRKFSDGNALTSTDVVYSFNKAKTSSTFGVILQDFASASASGNQVVFKLTKPNVLAHQLLTFPIVRQGTAENAQAHPAGTGRFVLSSENDILSLKSNGYYDKKVALTSINLASVKSSGTIENALKIGNLSFMYNDLSSGTMISSNSKSSSFLINNLVYIGFNQLNAITANTSFRRAVSFALSRDEISAMAYHGFANAALSPFNPQWKVASSSPISANKADSTAVSKELAQMGYKNTAVKILVNSENSYRLEAATIIAKQLSLHGINAYVSAVAFEQYNADLTAHNYDMFIGETKLTDDMNLNIFFAQGAPLSFSINLNESESAKSYEAYVNGTGEIGSFLMNFQNEMPFVPVIYRKGVVSYTNRMKVEPTSYYGDLYDNIDQWSF